MTILQDVVHAARLLRSAPIYTLTAVLSVAIGIGANAAIFSLADALLLRPRPGISDPAMLIDVGRSRRAEGFDNMSYPNFADYRERNTVGATAQSEFSAQLSRATSSTSSVCRWPSAAAFWRPMIAPAPPRPSPS